MNQQFFAMMTNPPSGLEAEFNNWYSNEHIPDVLALPGFTGAQRFEAVAPWGKGFPEPLRYLALYDIEDGQLATARDSLNAARAANAQAITEGKAPIMRPSPGSSGQAAGFWLQALTTRLWSHGANPQSSAVGHLMVILSNAKPHRDEEFNRWYNERHLGDVLNVPGFIWGQRFEIVGMHLDAPQEYRYLAMYGLETGRRQDAYDALFAELASSFAAVKSGTEPSMPLTDAAVPGGIGAWYDQLTEHYTNASVQKRNASHE